MTGLTATVGGSLAIAAVSTVADFIWAAWLPEHRMVYGLIHGTLLFLAIGLFLGVVSGHPAAGAVGGGAIGLLAAGAFYALAPLVGFSAMFVAWVGIWLALAALYARLTRVRIDVGNRHDVSGSVRAVASRGAIAAVASGVAFYAISGIWRPFNPQGLDYLVHFGAWTLAYAPGFAPLLLRAGRFNA